MSKRQIGKVAPAYEIRFSGTDSQIESVPIDPNLDQDRVPDPFKKRDKIPRHSGNISELLTNTVNSSPQKPSNIDTRTSSPTINKQNTKNIPDGFNNSQLKTLKDAINSNISFSKETDIPTKVKLWNAVGPDSENRVTTGKIENDQFMDNDNPTTSISSTIAFDSALRINQPNKKRPLPEESGSEKENVNVDADNTIQPPYSNKVLNGTTELFVSVNRKNTLKNKSRKINTNDYKDDDNNIVVKNHLSADGIATPPATPPRSPPMTPNSGSTVESVTNENVPLPSPQPSDDSQIIDSTSTETISTSQFQSTRAPRISKSRPIITAYSQELQEQVEIESPINDEPPKKNIISHDDIIIPTLAKKLKMNGQLPYSNHDALLGVSDEPDKVKPKPRPESGYMDITDQVENLFEDIIDQVENEQLTVTKKRASVVSQRRRRRSTPRRPTRRSRPNSQRNSKSFSEHYVQTDEIMIPSTVEDEPSNDDGVRKRNRKSRREEYVFLVRDEEEEDEINTEPITYSEPPTSTTPPPLPLEQVPVEQNEILADTNNDSLTAQYERHNITVHPVQSNVAPVALKLERTLTKSSINKKKQKKDKKSKKQNKKVEEDDDEDGYTKKSARCCIIC